MYSKERKKEIKADFQKALDSLTEKLKKDRYVIALFVSGSFNHDQPWEHSDIDVVIIVRDDVEISPATTSWGAINLVENGIFIDAGIWKRSDFKRELERQTQGSVMHSLLSKSRLVFSKDEQIENFYKDLLRIGNKDMEVNLIQYFDFIYKIIEKTRKWIYLKQDFVNAFWWYMLLVQQFARFEVIRNNELPQREIFKQALEINPVLFKEIYIDIIEQKIDLDTIERATDKISDYISSMTKDVYKPVIEYLQKEKGFRSQSEIVLKFKNRNLHPLCQPLVSEGIVITDIMPFQLTDKSKDMLDEPGYYYMG